MDELRKYNGDLGRVMREDTSRCVQSVPTCNGWHEKQCSRKRGYGKDGLYCKQHAKRYPQ
jgi:hypothetical protein